MTVGTQMQQAVAGLQGAAATIKTFALETEDQQAKKDFNRISQQLDNAVDVLKGRQKYIEQEEPQYKQQ
ncbi:DUF1657 domain-containing protein [Clostridium algidicarnis]|uniref:Uncharacterized protein DUF1657 n=2 Tax=Clostridium algidicarnis TaxID=37659 RepID=A0A2S6FWF2_9CLOT|nr:DUF1657 domain-containing protein [Clostridium algidicarnis]MBB6632054.1 DUF1657 domain-containing protein [Clostridium algidicarnis]MBB6698421.1 DUF1657 domain-containing protein [Clostridium algidicarnis]MBU3193714.1 DUF1657 domain-containing protein [Clostridium algidicarnis]MBU3204835.1 DUF1657 domain-containing protein [Clostridium algidicarnis]MBU3207270.1 DUF1657 domain-containing protein [Clostridium algidicarnis]